MAVKRRLKRTRVIFCCVPIAASSSRQDLLWAVCRALCLFASRRAFLLGSFVLTREALLSLVISSRTTVGGLVAFGKGYVGTLLSGTFQVVRIRPLGAVSKRSRIANCPVRKRMMSVRS